MIILTENTEWKYKFDTIKSHKFIYSNLSFDLETLKRICAQESIDLILCFNFECQSRFALNNRKKIFNSNIPWLIPTYENSELENKSKFIKWMKENSFTQYLPYSKSIHDYPYIIKTGNGRSAEFVYYISNENELKSIITNFSNKDYIIQEYIQDTKEYAFHFIAINGKIHRHLTYMHEFSNQVVPGTPYIKGSGFFNDKIESIALNKKQIDVLKQIIKTANYTGIGCIDFKISNDKIKIFEFNSRIGGSLFFFDHVFHKLDQFLDDATNLLKEYIASQ